MIAAFNLFLFITPKFVSFFSIKKKEEMFFMDAALQDRDTSSSSSAVA